jgi:two-component system chemotaxis response regulator CheB
MRGINGPSVAAPDSPRVIGIVAGSGGPEALAGILRGLPREFPLPILVAQGMPDDFVSPFVAWLADRCLISVAVAEDGQVPKPSKVYVASTMGQSNLLIVQDRLRLVEREARVYNSKDILFRSMARDLGPGAVAVTLTGPGMDGADGMKEVRDSGGFTIAQNATTSLIYGTAGFAVRLNAVCESLPLLEIAPRLLALVAAGAARSN